MPFDTKKILYYRNQEKEKVFFLEGGKRKVELLFLIIVAPGTNYKPYETLNMPLELFKGFPH